jgi:hypothetical protein
MADGVNSAFKGLNTYFFTSVYCLILLPKLNYNYLSTIKVSPPSPPSGTTAISGPGPPNYQGFTITLRQITLGRTPLDE